MVEGINADQRERAVGAVRGIRVSGKDATDFLHRVTAGSVKALAVGRGAGGVLCNGQSRMIAQFDLLRRAENEFWLVGPNPVELRAGLEALHFAEDLEFADAGIFSLRASSGQEREKIFSAGETAWPSAVPGYEVFSGEAPFPAAWDFDRIGAGVPWANDWDKNTPALEAGVLLWIDRHKGCYPGQEVVERSLNVGHPARALVAIEGNFTAGEKLPLFGGGEGLITSVGFIGEKGRAMVRVPWAKREMTGFTLLRGPL